MYILSIKHITQYFQSYFSESKQSLAYLIPSMDMFSLFKAPPANEDRLEMTSGSVLVVLDGIASMSSCLCWGVCACGGRVCVYACMWVYIYLFACILLSINSGSWQSQRERWH